MEGTVHVSHPLPTMKQDGAHALSSHPASSAMVVVENPIHRSQSSSRAEATEIKDGGGTATSSATIAGGIAFDLEDSLYGEKREIASKNDHPDEDTDAALTNPQWCEVSFMRLCYVTMYNCSDCGECPHHWGT